MLAERIAQGLAVRAARFGTRQNHDVQPAQRSLAQAKALSDQAFYAVSIDRLADVFLGNGQPQARSTRLAGAGQHGQAGVLRFERLGENVLEVGGLV